MKQILVFGFALLASCSGAKPPPDDGNVVQVFDKNGSMTPMDRKVMSGVSGTLVHVISLYEASISHMGAGDATIRIEDQGERKLALVLASYEAVDWHVEGPGAKAVTKVFLAGNESQSVDGVSDARVIDESGSNRPRQHRTSSSYGKENGFAGSPAVAQESFSCALTYARPDGGGCSAGSALVARALPRVGGSMATYTGIYNGSNFRIMRWPGS